MTFGGSFPLFVNDLVLAGAIVAGMTRVRNLPPEFRLFLVFLSFALLAEGIRLLLGIRGSNDHWVEHVIMPIRYTAYIAVFSFWVESQRIRVGLWISIPVYVLFTGICLVEVENLESFGYVSRPVGSTILAAVAASLLSPVTRRAGGKVWSDPKFWILAGSLIFFAVSVVAFALGNALIRFSREATHIVPGIQGVTGVLAHLAYGKAFVCFPPNPKSSGQ